VLRRLFSFAVAVFAATATAASAQTTAPATPQQGAGADQAQIDLAQIDFAQIDLGKTTYAEKCSHCHGPGMLNPGTITPDLRKFPDDKERFFTIVKQGKNNKMPPWADLLNDDQIGTLWVYISSRRKP
jgi:mono/diheme cytochrome c family protein